MNYCKLFPEKRKSSCQDARKHRKKRRRFRTNAEADKVRHETLILAGVANEIMSSDSSVVTNSYDGSLPSGVGSLTVQSFFMSDCILV